MADAKDKAPVVEQNVENVHIDEFLKGVKSESAVLKGMFKHFTSSVQGVEKATVSEFEKLLKDFKVLPVSELK